MDSFAGSSPPSMFFSTDPPEEPLVAAPAPAPAPPAPAAPTVSAPALSVPQLPSSEAFAAVAQLFQSSQGQQVCFYLFFCQLLHIFELLNILNVAGFYQELLIYVFKANGH